MEDAVAVEQREKTVVRIMFNSSSGNPNVLQQCKYLLYGDLVQTLMILSRKPV